jgi:hypothetical protein
MQNSRVPGGGRASGHAACCIGSRQLGAWSEQARFAKKLRYEPNHSAGNLGESEVSAVRTNPADW